MNAGPYEVEAWYNDNRDIIYVKIRRWLSADRSGSPSKRGVIMKWSSEVLELVMEDLSPAQDYPEADWSKLRPD